MNSVLTEPDADLFSSLFTADGTWVLINQAKRPQCIGTFASKEDAESFRDTHLPRSYIAAQMTDPSDVARERTNGRTVS